jgi:DNA polymerase elongation subunit (family B)
MRINFIPIDYDYFDYSNRTYIKIFGKTSEGKTCCLIDETDNFFYIITDKPEKLIKNIKGITNVEKCEIVEKNFLEKSVKAIRIFCQHNKMSEIKEEIHKYDKNFESKERDINVVTRYIIEKKIKPLFWYDLEVDILAKGDLGGIIDSLDVDLVIKLKNIYPNQFKEEKVFSPKVLAFDIETDDLEIGKGEILMISLVSDNIKKVLTWKHKSKRDFVEYYKSEEEMLEKFEEHVRKINPDIITGYFSDGFDIPYIRARAEKLKIDLKLSKDNSRILFSRGNEMSSRIKGRVHVDLLRFIRTYYSQYLQSETLSLNEVSSELLGEGKLDFGKKQETSSESLKKQDWEDYFDYNLQDSLLTYKLFQKIWPDILEFSRVIHEPTYHIIRQGMAQVVENYIIHHLYRFNEIIERKPIYEEIEKRKLREKYVGAFVLQPIPGLYKNLAFFDFTSYWPSIIVTFNLSKSTLLISKEKNSLEVDTGEKKFYFSKKLGFFPKMLGDIIEKRKLYKKEYNKNQSPITKARSNAFKLLANASYGYQGFFGARYYCPEASASATAISRDFTKKTIEEINKEEYNVIYSDSVDGKTKVIVKEKEKIYEEDIEKLFEKVDKKSEFGKEYNFKENIQVLTLDEKGNSVFKPITYVMRHKTNKKMFRIHFTNNWYIDVTEDHSLIGYQSSKFNQSKLNKNDVLKRLIEIKPTDINNKANTILTLKKIPNNKEKTKDYTKEVYEFMGYFIGDGSFMRNKSNQKYNKDYYLRLSLGLDKEEVFNKLILPLKETGHIKNHWWSKTRSGDLTVNGLKLVKIISKDCKDKNGKKAIPNWLFDEKEENICAFLRGLFSADGCVMVRNNAPIIKFTTIYPEYAEKIRKLLYRAGISHSIFKENSINKYKSEGKTYSSGSQSINIILKNKEVFAEKIGFLLERKNKLANIKTKNMQKKSIINFEFDLQSVKNIEGIKTPNYVYDIEVEDNHKFFANYVLVHNTDSIAFTLNKHNKEETLKLLEKLNKNLPGIMELDLEDFYKRGIWVTKRTGEFGAKKKYALIDYKDKIKIRGFETVRRDWCDLAREVQNNILKMILEEGNEENSFKYVKEVVKKLKNRKIDKEDLLIRTQLKKPISEYKLNSPHVTVAKKMEDAGMPVDVGMLISYYIAETKKEGKKLVRERAKLPDEKGEYDIEYYINYQILPAVENIFEVFKINIKEIFKETIDGKKQKKLGEY